MSQHFENHNKLLTSKEEAFRRAFGEHSPNVGINSVRNTNLKKYHSHQPDREQFRQRHQAGHYLGEGMQQMPSSEAQNYNHTQVDMNPGDIKRPPFGAGSMADRIREDREMWEDGSSDRSMGYDETGSNADFTNGDVEAEIQEGFDDAPIADFPAKDTKKGKLNSGFSWGKLISISVIITSILFLVAGGVLGYQIMAAGSSDDSKDKFSLFNIGGAFTRFLTSGRTELKGESTGRTNVLVVGVNDSPLENGLTDTIMIISYFHNEKKIATLNIPRDLYVSIPGQLEGKVNEVYPVFKRLRPNAKNYGIETLSNFLSRELDISIDYWATVNFDGVKSVIDTIGGIDVDVERTFTDCQYPTDDYSGYLPCQTFKQGTSQMDGTKALVYARSRKSLDPLEGTDFARSQRQARVLQAVLKKVKQKKLVENLTQVNNYLNIIGSNTQTNAKPNEMLSGALLLKDFDTENALVRGNWSDDVGFLCSGSIAGSYVLLFGDGINSCNDILGASKSKNSPYVKAGKEYVKNILKYAGDNEKARQELIKNTVTQPQTTQPLPTRPTASKTSSTATQIQSQDIEPVEETQNTTTEIPYTPDPQPVSSSSQPTASSSEQISSKASSQKSTTSKAVQSSNESS